MDTKKLLNRVSKSSGGTAKFYIVDCGMWMYSTKFAEG